MASRSNRKRKRINIDDAVELFTAGEFDQTGLHQGDGSVLPPNFSNAHALDKIIERVQTLEEAGFTVKHTYTVDTVSEAMARWHDKPAGTEIINPWLNTTGRKDGVSISFQTHFGKRRLGRNTPARAVRAPTVGKPWISAIKSSIVAFTEPGTIGKPSLKVRRASGGYTRVDGPTGKPVTTLDECLEVARYTIPEEVGKYELPEPIPFVDDEKHAAAIKDMIGDEELSRYSRYGYFFTDTIGIVANIASARVTQVSGVNKMGKLIRHTGNPKLAPFFKVTIHVLERSKLELKQWRILFGKDGYYVVDMTRFSISDRDEMPRLNSQDHEVLKLAAQKYLESI